MTERATILLPSIDFNAGTQIAAKRAYDLHAASFYQLPATFKIREALFWRQSPFAVPSGTMGDVCMAVDPGGYYVSSSDFPLVEKCQPRSLNDLGVLGIEPGATRRSQFKYYELDHVYRKGDRLIIAPELSGAGDMQVFAELVIEVASPLVLDPGIVWSQLNDAETGGGSYCIRNLIPSIASGGSQVAVHVAAGPHGGTITGVRVGVQSSGPNMVAAPVQALCGGQPSVVLPTGGGTWFVAPLATTAGMSLLVQVGISGYWAHRNVSPYPSWTSDTDSGANATMQGTITPMPTRCYVIDCVKVLP